MLFCVKLTILLLLLICYRLRIRDPIDAKNWKEIGGGGDLTLKKQSNTPIDTMHARSLDATVGE